MGNHLLQGSRSEERSLTPVLLRRLPREPIQVLRKAVEVEVIPLLPVLRNDESNKIQLLHNLKRKPLRRYQGKIFQLLPVTKRQLKAQKWSNHKTRVRLSKNQTPALSWVKVAQLQPLQCHSPAWEAPKLVISRNKQSQSILHLWLTTKRLRTVPSTTSNSRIRTRAKAVARK